MTIHAIRAIVKKEQLMQTRIFTLISAIIVVLSATVSFAEDTASHDDTKEQSPVCMTHRISDATGECRNAFMQAYSALSQKCGNSNSLDEASTGYVNEYISACNCSSECRQ